MKCGCSARFAELGKYQRTQSCVILASKPAGQKNQLIATMNTQLKNGKEMKYEIP
jgi:hypothetical protein